MNNKSSLEVIDEGMNIEKYEIEDIKQKIYTIRGKQVMLDSDVAMLYEYSTKNINKAMNRNINRFPEDFCFQLIEEEVLNLRFQNGTSSLKQENYGGRRYSPYAYTEQGIAMLSGILKSDVAIQMSIKIIRAFIEMRNFLINNGQIFNRLTNVEYKLLEHDKKFEEVFNQFQIKDNVKQKVFFEGQIYDAFSMIIDLIKKAKKEIILIDNYVDIETLNVLTKKNDKVTVLIITKNDTKISKQDIFKFNKQYTKLEVKFTDKFHDIFFILDKKYIYHIGASIKDLGKKCFGITLIKYESIIEDILLKVHNI